MDDLSGTYFVQDKSDQDELQRLIVQERLVTRSMGGVLPEQPDPSRLRRVLDIGCGPGGWLLEVAQRYPEIQQLYGIDISPTMIRAARQRAEEQHLSEERVKFLVMDALLVLEFPDEFFDLINLRFGVSFMRKWDWPRMFGEMQRLLADKGVARLVEGKINIESSSVALSTFGARLQHAFYRAGYLFEETPTGLIDHLPELLQRHNFCDIQVHEIPVTYAGGTEACKALLADYMHIFRTSRPFLQRYGCLPEDYEALCRQAVLDMQQPDFVARGTYYTLCAVLL